MISENDSSNSRWGVGWYPSFPFLPSLFPRKPQEARCISEFRSEAQEGVTFDSQPQR